MRVAIAQMNPRVGDFERNMTSALEYARTAERSGARLVVYPAGALTGVGLGGLLASEAFCVRAQACAEVFAQNTPVAAVIGSAIWDAGAGAGRPMTYLCRGGEALPLDEDVDVVPAFEVEGRSFVVFGDEVATFADDAATPDAIISLRASAYRGGASLPLADAALERSARSAREAGAWFLYAGIVGGFDDLVFPGCSFCLDATGGVVASARPFSTALLLGDLFETGDAGPAIDVTDGPGGHLGLPGEVALDYEALVLAVHDYFDKNALSDALIGLSGGIDSALVAAIAVDALGSEHVHGVMMPSRVSSEGSVTDSRALAANLGISVEKVSIRKPLEAFDSALKDICEGRLEGLALENTQARIRTVYLMAIANTYGWILLNTGNKSEAAMGFSTLYGDTAGAFAPIGDVYKTRVYELARWRNQQGMAIPREILVKAPSAELYEGARDSDRLPEYGVLDRILAAHVEGGEDLAGLVEAGFDRSLCDDVLRKVRGCEFKRRQEPPAPGISPRSFDLRAWPVTCSFVDR